MHRLSLPSAELAQQVDTELCRRGYYIMGADELAQLWEARASAVERSAALRDFAAQVGATVTAWHDSGAFLRRGGGFSGPNAIYPP